MKYVAGEEKAGIAQRKNLPWQPAREVRPLPVRPAGEAVRRLAEPSCGPCDRLPACPAGEAVLRLRGAAELLHLPDEPAGVEDKAQHRMLAGELLHLPGKPAG